MRSPSEPIENMWWPDAVVIDGLPSPDGAPFATMDEVLAVAGTKAALLQELRDTSGSPARAPKPRSIEAMLNDTPGPILEIGGPTPDLGEGDIVDTMALDRPVLISNVSAPNLRMVAWRSRRDRCEERSPIRPDKSYKFRGENRVISQGSGDDTETVALDLYIDAGRMPAGEGYLGAIIGAGLLPDVEASCISGGARTLGPGGLLLLRNAELSTRRLAKASPHFDVVRARLALSSCGWIADPLVARRNETPYEAS
jgi:hypothetical protein